MALVQPLAIPRELWSSSPACTSRGACPFSCSAWGDGVRESSVLPGRLSGRKIKREKLWREFFSDPSQWWDNRSEKVNPRYPDFKHKKTKQPLWLIDNLNPPWVESEMAAMSACTLQSDVFSWNVRLRRFVKAGDYKRTLNLFQQMIREGMILDKFTFVPVLKACSGLHSFEIGRNVHQQIIERGYEHDVYVATCLVDMYAKCGSIEDSWRVFNGMPEHDVVSWNAMIRGFVKSGHGPKAMELFEKMQLEGVEPNAVTVIGMLNACASVSALEEGRRVHQTIIRRGYESDVNTATCLVDMYAKCGSIGDAWIVFDKMQKRDVVSWNAMIGGYVKSGQGLKAMELFRRMRQEGVQPSSATFGGVLNACASVAALQEGKHVHEQIIQAGCQSDVYVANCLVLMYAKCGSIGDAWRVFNKMREHHVVSWNAMIAGYVKYGQGLKSLELFRKMQQEDVEPNVVTLVGVLVACASIPALEEGRRVHQQILRRGWESNVYVATCLVDMYGKCGSIEDAWSVFNEMQEHNVVSWSAMIGGYVKSGQGLKAMELFRKMQQEGVGPDAVTFVGVLNACASVGTLDEGRCVHEQIIRQGCESNGYIATCLVDMYAKCGSIEDAWRVFNKIQKHNVGSWNAMIGGYVRSGQGLKGMELFREMQREGVEPNGVTFVGVLNACASEAALEEGRRVHELLIQKDCESDVYIATCLVDMYAKCGSIEDAWSVFTRMPEHNVVSWSAMIRGFAMHGDANKAVGLFKRMCKEGADVNGITFTCLLAACSHGGLVKEGLRYYKSMTSCFNILPALEHFVCMVDLLGRAGQLEEAEEMANLMPGKENASVWTSLLGACRTHGEVEMAERVAKQCEGLNFENASDNVLMSNLYAAGKAGVCSH